MAGETLADQPSDIATQRVTLFMLQNLRGRVEPGLATIMDRMAAAFQVSRSA